MNKIFKSLVLAALATGAVCAHDHTNHTTMTLRSHGYNLPMNFTTFDELVNRKADDKFGGNFQVTGFYQASNSSKELGKYFGMNHHNEMTLGHVVTTGADLTPAADLDIAYLIHEAVPVASSNTIEFKPKSDSYGATFAYYQDLEKITKGLFLSVSLPVVHVENDMKMEVGTGVGSAVAANVISYFKGTFTGINGTTDLQTVLTKGKIDGKRSETGVADIEVKLGYNFLRKDWYHLGLNLGLTIPTGNENKADYVFAPIVGNGKHFALGAGLEGNVRVWGDEDQNIKLAMVLDYRYLFENSEHRTLGLKNAAGVTRNWGQYHLLGSAGTTNVTVLTPAANIITQNCKVTPGSQLEGLANFAYNNGGFTFDLGYNMFWREKESVKIKHLDLDANTYGVANRALPASTNVMPAQTYYGNEGTITTAANFGLKTKHFDEGHAAADVLTTAYWLGEANLDTHAATTPSVFTNKIYTGIGYSFKEWDTPLMMGLGGSYEFGSKNSAPDFWSVSGKLGVAF